MADNIFSRSYTPAAKPADAKTTLEQISAQTRVPVNVLMAFGEAAGAQTPEDLVRIATEAGDFMGKELAAGRSIEEILRSNAGGDDALAGKILDRAKQLRAELYPDMTPTPPQSGAPSDANALRDLSAGFGGALVRGTGSAIDYLGNAADRGLDTLIGAPVRAMTGRTDRVEVFSPATDLIGGAIRSGGEYLQGFVSEEARQAAQKSMPTGDVLDPSTWRAPEDMTVRGVMQVASEGLGSLAPVVVAALVSKNPQAVSAILGGSMAGGDGRDTAAQIIDSMYAARDANGVSELEKDSDLFQSLVAQGVSKEDAYAHVREQAMNVSGDLQAIVGGLGGAVTGRLVSKGLPAALAGSSLTGNIARGVVAGALEEGTQEALETTFARAGVNIGAGTSINPTEGTLEAAAMGALVGGPVGGLSGGRTDEPPAVPQPAPKPAGGPLRQAMNEAAPQPVAPTVGMPTVTSTTVVEDGRNGGRNQRTIARLSNGDTMEIDGTLDNPQVAAAFDAEMQTRYGQATQQAAPLRTAAGSAPAPLFAGLQPGAPVTVTVQGGDSFQATFDSETPLGITVIDEDGAYQEIPRAEFEAGTVSLGGALNPLIEEGTPPKVPTSPLIQESPTSPARPTMSAPAAEAMDYFEERAALIQADGASREEANARAAQLTLDYIGRMGVTDDADLNEMSSALAAQLEAAAPVTTPTAQPAPAADPDRIMGKDNMPFPTEKRAQDALSKLGEKAKQYRVEAIENGFALVKRPQAQEEAGVRPDGMAGIGQAGTLGGDQPAGGQRDPRNALEGQGTGAVAGTGVVEGLAGATGVTEQGGSLTPEPAGVADVAGVAQDDDASAWDVMNQDERADAVKRAGYVTAKGNVSGPGKNLAASPWASLPDAAKDKLRGVLRAPAPAQAEPAQTEATQAPAPQEEAAPQPEAQTQPEAPAPQAETQAEAPAAPETAPEPQAEAPQQPASPTGVDYPNRKLGFRYAKADSVVDGLGDSSDNSLGNIALANAQAGDVLPGVGTVEKVTEKQIQIRLQTGVLKRLSVDTDGFSLLARDMGALIAASANLNSERLGSLMDMIERDPAMTYQNGVPVLIDDPEVRGERPARPNNSILRPLTGTKPPTAPQPETETEARPEEAPADDQAAAITEAAAQADPNPTPALAEAGNYRKGHVGWNGLDLTIETAKGSERRGKDADGEEWSVTMPADYGYIKRTEGADGEQVDFYMGEMPASDLVVIVNQIDPETGAFDEHKAIFGTASTAQALSLYEAGFSDGRGKQRIGSYTVTTVEGFKNWLAAGDLTKPTQPVTGGTKRGPKLQDFGEKIGGARKDMANRFKAELTSDEIEGLTLAQAVPEPNYAALRNDLMLPPRTLALISLIRAAIPRKPSEARSYKMDRWIQRVENAREMIAGLIDGTKTENDWAKSLQSRHVIPYTALLTQMQDMEIAEMGLIGRALWETPLTIYEAGIWDAGNETRLRDKLDLLVDRYKQKAADRGNAEKYNFDFHIRYNREGGQGFIYARNPKNTKIMSFDTVAEAREFLDDEENRAELQRIASELKNGPPERRMTNRDRIGPMRRTGDVTPEQFTEAFGFRGAEFGNYVTAAERQGFLNATYDALMDLAGAMNVPPRTLSLNGGLGIGFGSRGRGNAGGFTAAAHYEPSKRVINLTRRAGAGSLAHEWWHAVDHFLTSLAGRGDYGMLSETRAARRGYRQEWTDEQQAIADAMERFVSRVQATEWHKRMVKLDAMKSKPYWSTPAEETARAFEAAVVERLEDRDMVNDFLVNIDQNAGAYPTQKDMGRGIRSAADAVIGLISVQFRADGGDVPQMPDLVQNARSRPPRVGDQWLGPEGERRAIVAEAEDGKLVLRPAADKDTVTLTVDQVQAIRGNDDWLNSEQGKAEAAKAKAEAEEAAFKAQQLAEKRSARAKRVREFIAARGRGDLDAIMERLDTVVKGHGMRLGDMVEEMIEDGATFGDHGWLRSGRRALSPDTLGKVIVEYARWMIGQRDGQPTVDIGSFAAPKRPVDTIKAEMQAAYEEAAQKQAENDLTGVADALLKVFAARDELALQIGQKEADAAMDDAAKAMDAKEAEPDLGAMFDDILDELTGGDEGQGAQTPAPEQPTAPETDRIVLGRAIAEALRSGTVDLSTIVKARKFAQSRMGKEMPDKEIEEAFEAGLVLRAREIAADPDLAGEEAFSALVTLYNNQPNLITRTSTSVEQQAYSTPAPLAYLATYLARITPKLNGRIYEPTAGNGMLLMTADPANVVLNELNPDRFAVVSAIYRGATMNQGDAMAYDPQGEFDRIITNPPFGKVKNEQGVTQRFDLGGSKTTEIDHAIVWKSLAKLKSNGRAVLIIGGHQGDIEARRKGYRADNAFRFMTKLYDAFNVTEHFTVDGALYRRQGAGWPVDVIVIEGTGKSELPYPYVDVPPLYSEWTDLGERLNYGAGSLDTRGKRVGGRDGDLGQAPDGTPDAGTLGGGAGRPDQQSGSQGQRAGTGSGTGSGVPDGGAGPSGEAGVRTSGGKLGPAQQGGGLQSDVAGGTGGDQAATGNAGNADGGDASGLSGSDLRLTPEQRAAVDAALSEGYRFVRAYQSTERNFTQWVIDFTDDLDTFSAYGVTFDEAVDDVRSLMASFARIRQQVEGQNPQQQTTPRNPAPRNPAPRSPSEAAESAAQNIGESFADFAKGLNAIFDIDPNRLNSGLPVSDEAYQKAKPFFIAAVRKLGLAGKDIADVMRGVIRQLLDAGLTKRAVQNMKDAVTRFVSEVQKGIIPRAELEAQPEPKAPQAAPKKQRENTEAETNYQVQYQPHSTAEFAVGTLVPRNMQQAMDSALNALAERVGDLDAFVADRLGMTREEVTGTPTKAGKFSAEQVDALALAIDNIENGGGFIIGDQTGVGKGRVVAGILRYAMKQGRVPVFVTKQPGLFGDMVRDLRDIGVSGIEKRILPSKVLRGADAVPLSNTPGDVLESPSDNKLKNAFAEMRKTGRLPDGYDMLFTTYSQLQYKAGSVGVKTFRQEGLDAVAANSIIVLDESHEAGGTETRKFDKDTGEMVPTRADYFREVIQSASGVMYSSATYAKNPTVMSLYSRTDIRMAVDDMDKLADAIRAGGVPLQQVMANMLVKSGQYVRRERSFEGVSMNLRVLDTDQAVAATGSKLVATVFNLDRDYMALLRGGFMSKLAEQGLIDVKDISVGEEGADTMGFANIMHNLVNQMFFGLKAEAVVAQAIDLHRQGVKPLIAVSNTNESILRDYVQALDLKAGDPVDMPFNEIFRRYLARLRRVTVKDSNGNKRHFSMTDADILDLGGREVLNAIKAVEKQIEDADLSGVPAMPLDYVLDRMEEAGMKVGEITGRGLTSRGGKVTPRESSDAIKKRTMNDFNSGKIDAVVLNQSGSTGFSLHARNAKDNDGKKRHMIVLQPDPNIDVFMQMLGRVHRTGQSQLPDYTIAVSDLALEKRVAANLMRKMASLNANTTAAKDSAISLDNVTDFMNRYGDQVIADMLREDEDLASRLNIRVSATGAPAEGLAQKVTGRMAVLSPREVADLYDRIETAYREYVDALDRMGLNMLEAKTLDLQARVLDSAELTSARDGGDSPFAEAAYIERMSVRRLGRSFTSAQVQAEVAKELDGKTGREYAAEIGKMLDGMLPDYQDKLRVGLDEANQRLAEAATDAQKERAAASVAAWEKKILDAEATVEAIKREVETLRPGALVYLTLREDGQDLQFYAVPLAINTKGVKGNPTAASTIKIRFAIADAAREVVVPLSKLMSQDSPFSYTVMQNVNAAANAFDAGQSESREERQIITGNILSGYSQFTRGQIVMFTREDGSIGQGVLMPRAFDAQAEMDARSVKFATVDQVIRFLSEGRNRLVKTEDGVVGISKNWNSYSLMVRRQGGKPYYLNQAVRRIVGDFESGRGDKAKNFTKTVDSEADVRAALQAWIDNVGAEYVTDSHKDEAREITGQRRFGENAEMRGSVAATLTGTELGAYSDIRDLGRKAEAWYRSNLVGTTVTNAATGMVIRFNARGAKKTAGRKGEDLYRMVPALREILANGQLIGTEQDRKSRSEVKAVHKVQADVSLEGRIVSVIATVREMQDGTFHYDLSTDNAASSGAADRVTEARSGQPDDNGGGSEVLRGRGPANPTVELRGSTSALEGEPAFLNLEFAPVENKPRMSAERIRAVAERLNAELARTGIDRTVRARVVRGLMDEAGVEIQGRQRGDVLEVNPNAPAGALGVLRHEIVHVLRDAGLWGQPYGLFEQGEWRGLVAEARKRTDIRARVERDYKGRNLTEAQITEEIIAEMYREWARSRDAAGGLARVFGKIRGFLRAVANALRGQGFQSAGQTFERIANGTVGGRGPNGGGGGGRSAEMRGAQTKIDTLAFRRWFGDSKVVDARGRPLVVYHGTKADIVAFTKQSHFGTLKAATARLAARSGDGKNIVPVYLSIQNPLTVSDNEASDEAAFLGAIKRGKYPQIDLGIANRQGAIAAAQAAGYDGFIYENLIEDRGKKSFVAFEPTQVKSVFNSGAFSGDSARISEMRASTKSFRDVFRVDNPGGEWLKGKIERVAEAAKRAGAPRYVTNRIGGATTGYLTEAVMMPVDALAALPPANGEKRVKGEYQYDLLAREVEAMGWNDDQFGNAVLVEINDQGQAFITEGNTRVAIAKANGIRQIKTEIRWLNGGEAKDGPMHPDKVEAMATVYERPAPELRMPTMPFARDEDAFEKNERSFMGRLLTDAMGGASSNYNLLALVPGRALYNELGKNLPSARKYLRLKEEMDALRSEWHGVTDEVATRWREALSKDGASNKAMMDLMHDATRAGVDPAERFERPAKRRGELPEEYAAKVARLQEAYDTLRPRWEALPDVFKGLYREVRDTYSKLSDAFEKTLIENAKTAMSINVEKARMAYERDMEKIAEEGLTGQARADAEETAKKKLATAERKAEWGINARITKLRLQFETNRIDGPYFPLMRHGNYFVTVRDEDGKVVSFSRFESESMQKRFVKEQRQVAGQNVDFGVMKDSDLREQVDPNFVAEVEALLGEYTGDRNLMDAVWQRWLETLPDFSVRRSRIHRKGTPGFDGDAFRAFGKQVFHGGHQLARLKYGMQLNHALDKARAEAAASSDPNRNGLIVNEMGKRNDFVMNPKGGKLAQVATTASFIYYLGITPAAAIVNLSQTTIVGIPVLAAGFRQGSIARAARELSRAMGDFLAGRADAARSPRVSVDERAALEEAYRRGTIDKSQAHDLAGVAESGVEYSNLRMRVMKPISFLFHHAERMNREITYLAAYRMARDYGMGHADAVQKAADLTWKTHFDYQNTSRPRLMQNDFAKVALVFRNFAVNMLWRLFRDAHQMFKGKSAEERREARTQLIGISAMMMLHAGVTGTWGYGLLMTMAGLFLGGADEAEEEVKRAVVETFGTGLGGLILKGVPGHLTGINLTDRIGMPDLWFRSPERQLEGDDEYWYWVEQVLGAFPGIIHNVWRGVQQIGEGNVWRGVETASPKAIRDLMKGYRYTAEGVRTYDGDPILEDVSAGDAFMQAMGFTPAQIAERYETNTRLKNAEGRIVRERTSILKDVTAAIRSGAAVPAELREAIMEFNAANPTYPITSDSIMRSLRSDIRASRDMEGGIRLNNRLDGTLRTQAAPSIYQ